MFHFIVLLIKAVFLLFSGKKKDVVIENLILKKELEIIKRKNVKRIKFRFIDKLFYAIFNNIFQKVKEYITLIKPETVLKWQSDSIKRFWTFPSKKSIFYFFFFFFFLNLKKGLSVCAAIIKSLIFFTISGFSPARSFFSLISDFML